MRPIRGYLRYLKHQKVAAAGKRIIHILVLSYSCVKQIQWYIGHIITLAFLIILHVAFVLIH